MCNEAVCQIEHNRDADHDEKLSFLSCGHLHFCRTPQLSHAELKTIDWKASIVEALDVASGSAPVFWFVD